MEYKDKKYTYLGGLVHGISTLATGMKTSIKVYFRKKVTEQYPENRKELKMFDRFRGTLNMPHNENNEHRCVACGLCQMACPNDTIKVTGETIETEDGKKKKILAKYEYDLGSCIFCQLCVNACPHDAITFDQNFEHAVFDRAIFTTGIHISTNLGIQRHFFIYVCIVRLLFHSFCLKEEISQTVEDRRSVIDLNSTKFMRSVSDYRISSRIHTSS